MSKIDIVNEIHKNVRLNFPRRHVIMKDIDDLWQADLIDMQNIHKQNSNYKYILIIIDTFSKFAWAFPLKRKTKDEVSNAFETLLVQGRSPKNLQTDLGKEFYNEKFKSVVKKFSINHYSTFSTKKASIVERLIRTIKSKLYKTFSLKGNYIWIDNTLNEIIYNYNNTFHRTIGCKPAEINKYNKKTILERYARIQKIDCKSSKEKKLKIGDYVRVSKYKGAFEKGYTPNWSSEIFKIINVQKTTPVTYLIEDSRLQPILGAFYGYELQKTMHPHLYLVERILKKKDNKVFVKWLGLPSSENNWINKSDIV